jgi:hypothetical protein
MRQDAVKWLCGVGTSATLVIGFFHFSGNEGPAYFTRGGVEQFIEFSTLERCHEFIASIGYDDADTKTWLCHLK